MKGLMLDQPLLISSIARHAELNHPEVEIVSITADNADHRYSYAECVARSRRLANALTGMGMQLGDRVGTIAWNDYRHVEIYFAVSGAGGVCHTINPRLFGEQLIYIINHAGDRWICIDPQFVPLLEQLAEHLSGVEGYIVMTDEAHMPDSSLDNLICYESLLASASDGYDWPVFDEYTASSLCYTSGTTGNPKGVLYSHRSTLIHAYAAALPDVLGISSQDCVLPVVPMFHVNAWGVPYSCPIVGAKMIFPGPRMGDGEALCRLIENEGVTLSLGVPTVWLAVLSYLAETGKTLGSLQRVVIGGAACPPFIMTELRRKYGVRVRHGWGMTEMSPLGVTNTPKGGMADLPEDEYHAIEIKQGRGIFGVEMKIVDEQDRSLPWDGEAFGTLKVRGPWVCSDYYELDGESSAHDADGWFDTGDVATIDAQGYLWITDRTKDVIKSGGEWISSIELENTAVAHPAVAEAAVIGVQHPKWTERPLLIAVLKEGERLDKQKLLEWFDGKVASWWVPDDVAFVDELPHTATGKVQKRDLREQFKDFVLPDNTAA